MNGALRSAPSLRVADTVTSVQLSFASAEPVATTAEGRCRSLSAVIAPGAVRNGFSLSTTVTVCCLLSVMPSVSVAVQVIVVTPFGYGASRAAPSLLTPTIETTPMSSVAVAVPTSTDATHEPTPAATPAAIEAAAGAVLVETFAGAVTVGGRGGVNRT